MAKVHPLPSSYSSSSSYVTSKRESFTIWMKSLVMNGNGCTVFNENGDILYRIDNYEKKGSREVYLMDLQGKVLFTLRKVHFFKRWECYKGDNGSNSNNYKQKPVFQVTKNGHITLLRSHNADFYKLEALGGNCKSALMKIVNNQGGVVAETKRKQSSSSGNSVVLGDDVLTLVVDAHVDHSLVVALFTVNGLIQRML